MSRGFTNSILVGDQPGFDDGIMHEKLDAYIGRWSKGSKDGAKEGTIDGNLMGMLVDLRLGTMRVAGM